MARGTPTTSRTVYALSDLRRVLAPLLDDDPETNPDPDETKLLLKISCGLAQKADMDRRTNHNEEDYGQVTLRNVRERGEFEREYSDVIPLFDRYAA